MYKVYVKTDIRGRITEINSDAKNVQVTHSGKTWISVVDNNVWEPCAADVYENIWKGVI